VDELDLRIFRWMYPRGVWSWWGTDPRITTTEIGSHVGLERTAVWARIRRWKREGFWNGFAVHVNPRIFDARHARVEIPVLGAAQGADVLDRLEHVDGALYARLGFGVTVHGREGEAVALSLAAEDATRVRRRVRILRGLSSTGEVAGPFYDRVPQCSHRLTPLDWRILAAVVANPNASPARLARLVGITRKTLAHRHANLIDRHAIFYVPLVDWSRLACVCLEVFCRETEDVDRVRQELQARYPAMIPMDLSGGEGIAPEWVHSTCFAALVPAQSPNGIHALIRDTSQIPGVKLVRQETSGPERLYFDWVNRRLADQMASTAVTVTRRASSWESRKRSGQSVTPGSDERGAVTP